MVCQGQVSWRRKPSRACVKMCNKSPATPKRVDSTRALFGSSRPMQSPGLPFSGRQAVARRLVPPVRSLDRPGKFIRLGIVDVDTIEWVGRATRGCRPMSLAYSRKAREGLAVSEFGFVTAHSIDQRRPSGGRPSISAAREQNQGEMDALQSQCEISGLFLPGRAPERRDTWRGRVRAAASLTAPAPQHHRHLHRPPPKLSPPMSRLSFFSSPRYRYRLFGRCVHGRRYCRRDEIAWFKFVVTILGSLSFSPRRRP